jgi:hypothetical protein
MPEKIEFHRKPNLLSQPETEKLERSRKFYEKLSDATVYPAAFVYALLVPIGVWAGSFLAPFIAFVIASSVFLGCLKCKAITIDCKFRLDENRKLQRSWTLYQQQIAQNLRANRAARLERKPPYADPKQAVRDIKEIFLNLSAPIGTTPHQKWDQLRRFCHARGIMKRPQSSIGLG